MREGREGVSEKVEINPVRLPMHDAPRCGAKTRRGSPCLSPAMPNGRCRMHGGLSPGAPRGNRNALKHGQFTAEAIQERRSLRQWIKEARQFVRDLGE